MARYTAEQKEAVINRAREIGAAAAAKAEGVSYQTVLKWMKEEVSSLPADTISSLDRQIEQTERGTCQVASGPH